MGRVRRLRFVRQLSMNIPFLSPGRAPAPALLRSSTRAPVRAPVCASAPRQAAVLRPQHTDTTCKGGRVMRLILQPLAICLAEERGSARGAVLPCTGLVFGRRLWAIGWRVASDIHSARQVARLQIQCLAVEVIADLPCQETSRCAMARGGTDYKRNRLRKLSTLA